MNIFSKSIVPHTKKANMGMYIGEEHNPNCKQCKQTLITKCPDLSTAYEYEIGTYVRNSKYHKKGDVKTQTRYKVWDYIYSDILQAWEAVWEYPTVSYGLTKNEANVLIVDVDEEFESIEEVEKTLGEVQPTYIIRNPISKHIQFGFVLKETFNFRVYGERARFNTCIKTLSNIFDSDVCYNGPACKNPFYYEFDSKVYRDRIYDIEEVGNICKKYKKDIKVIEEKKENKKGMCFFVLYNTNTIQNNTNQTNHVKTYMNLLRNKIFAYFRQNKQQCPEQVAKVFEQEVIDEMTKDGWVFNNMKQTIDATKKILDWCNTKGWSRFGVRDGSIQGEVNSTLYQIRGREKSIETRKKKKEEKIVKYREWMSKNVGKVAFSRNGKAKEGMISQKEAAKQIGISYDEFRAYRKMEERGEISYEVQEEDMSKNYSEMELREYFKKRDIAKIDRDEMNEQAEQKDPCAGCTHHCIECHMGKCYFTLTNTKEKLLA